MVNLIPQEDLEQTNIEYKKRLMVVFGVTFLVGFGLLAALLLPVPFSLSSLESQISQREKSLRADLKNAGGEGSLKNLADTESKANFIISSQVKRPSPQASLREIAGLKSEGVSITGVEFTYNEAKKGGNPYSDLNITGSARYRDNLVNFIDALKKSTHFKNVNVPIQSLLKSEKIDFQITMTSDF